MSIKWPQLFNNGEISVNIKDLKYEKLVDAYNAELKKQEDIKRKQQAQKSLDF